MRILISAYLLLVLVGAVLAEDVRSTATDLVTRLNAVKTAARELRGGKVKADAYLDALKGAQDAMVAALAQRGVAARRCARFDFGGLPIPKMMRDAGRQVQEDAVISATGHLEIGRGRIADAILIEPKADGAFVNRLAAVLKSRFGIATVIEAGSVDNESAAASFSGDAGTMSIPLCDALADAISYMTYHELYHLAGHVSAGGAPPNAIDGRFDGEKLAAFFTEPLYASGFSVDEIAAYPEGVHYSASLLAATGGRELAVPFSSAEWKVLDAQVFGHQLRLLSADRHRAALLNQLVSTLEPFFNAVDGALAALAAPAAPAQVDARAFLGESLILTGQGAEVQVSLDLMTDGLLGDGTPLAHPTIARRSLKGKLGVTLPLAPQLAAPAIAVLKTASVQGSTQAAGSPAFVVHQGAMAATDALIEPLRAWVAELRALNGRLRAAMEKSQLADAEAVVAELAAKTRTLSGARAHERLQALRSELGF